MINIPKGTKDILPSESYKWQWLEGKFKAICERYGFKEIRTPLFEHTELFERGIGDTTDVVQKEMYSFEIAERSLTLKPEGTAGIARAFIESKLYADVIPAKYWYETACYRYEKMQKGRQREFHQFGIEIFGSENMLADAEVISLAYDFLYNVGVPDLIVKINSIGCPECRAKYRKALQDFIEPNLSKLCGTCKDRFSRNPMRILDCKSAECKRHCEGAPRMLDYLCGDCSNAFEDLKSKLNILEVPYEVDTGIVRGLDYYTKTAFEIKSDLLGAQSTVCGGGRYDHLMEQLDGPKMPGVGFGLGIERLLLLLEEANIEIPVPEYCRILVAGLGESGKKEAMKLAGSLRKSGIKTCMDVSDRNLKSQFKYADRLGVRYVAIIGDEELEKGMVSLRDMQNSSQKEIPLTELLREIE